MGRDLGIYSSVSTAGSSTTREFIYQLGSFTGLPTRRSRFYRRGQVDVAENRSNNNNNTKTRHTRIVRETLRHLLK